MWCLVLLRAKGVGTAVRRKVKKGRNNDAENTILSEYRIESDTERES